MSARKTSMENYLVQSSLFKQEKKKLYSPYVSQQQYFSTLQEQKKSNYKSHIRAIQSSRQDYFNNTPYPTININPPPPPKPQPEEQKISAYSEQPIGNQREQKLPPISQEGQTVAINSNGVKQSNFTAQKRRDLRTQGHNLNIVISPQPSPKHQSQIEDRGFQTEEFLLINTPFQSTSNQALGLRTTEANERGGSNEMKQALQQIEGSNQFSNAYSAYSQPNNQSFNKSSNLRKTNQVYSKQLDLINVQSNKSVSQQLQKNSTQRSNFFSSTKTETAKYLQMIKSQLRQAYYNIQDIQLEIDKIIDRNLQLQCEKVRTSLLKVIECQLSEFKASEMRQLHKNKFMYMADLYQIKCNIDLRLQEIQDYQDMLRREDEWKKIVGALLTPDYESNIQIVLAKAGELQEESMDKTNNFLTYYSATMFEAVHEPLRREMKSAIESLFCNFSLQWEKRMAKNQRFGYFRQTQTQIVRSNREKYDTGSKITDFIT